MLPARKPKVRSGIERAQPIRSPRHLKWLRGFLCACCGNDGRIEAAHLRIGTDGGIGIKPGDQWALPLESECHRRQHNVGERTFWKSAGKDAHKLAAEFASKSPDPIIREAGRHMSAVQHMESR